MLLAIHDLADLFEQPLHKLGLHGAAWVIATGCLGVLALAATRLAYRRIRH
jgi:hypothetical protein